MEKATPDMYQNILNALHDNRYVANTFTSHHATANMIFKFAIKKKWIKDNPCTGSVIPKKRITIEDIEKMAMEDKYLET